MSTELSGTRPALNQPALVAVSTTGEALTTSAIIAAGTNNEHASVIRLIRDNLADLTEFGRVGFEIAPLETAGGTQHREIARLNEQHATLLLTYMRNNEIVKDFKKRLVHQFWEMRHQLDRPALSDDEIIHRALQLTTQRVTELTARVAVLEPKAELAEDYLTAQGGARLVRLVAKTFGLKETDLRRFLVDEGLIYVRHSQCGDVQYDHYAQFAHYFLPRETVVQHQWGSCNHYTLMVLPRGVELISQRLRKKGML